MVATASDKKQFRYNCNGLYGPRAKDSLPGDDEKKNLLVDVPGFLEACCVRLERLFPDVPHVASLVKEMRAFAKHEVVAEFPELDDSGCIGACVGALTEFDSTLPEQVMPRRPGINKVIRNYVKALQSWCKHLERENKELKRQLKKAK